MENRNFNGKDVSDPGARVGAQMLKTLMMNESPTLAPGSEKSQIQLASKDVIVSGKLSAQIRTGPRKVRTGPRKSV